MSRGEGERGEGGGGRGQGGDIVFHRVYFDDELHQQDLDYYEMALSQFIQGPVHLLVRLVKPLLSGQIFFCD